MKKEDLIQQLNEVESSLEQYPSKMLDLFKDEDDPKKILVELRITMQRIKMMLDAMHIKELKHPTNKALISPIFGKAGDLVKVKPVNEKYGNKTYAGFLIGEIALGSSIKVDTDCIQLDFSGHNPAIFVPELGEVIYGCESWWSSIKNLDELKDITDEDIANVWYVKFLKSQLEDECSKPL